MFGTYHKLVLIELIQEKSNIGKPKMYTRIKKKLKDEKNKINYKIGRQIKYLRK